MDTQPNSVSAVVTLKNLYRLLMNADYPTPSAQVIAASRKKGMTLIRFWQGVLLPDVITDAKSERLWRTSGSRNRYLSDLTNRTGGKSFYSEYFDALEARLSPLLLSGILSRMREYLRQCAFSYPVLKEKLRVFLDCAGRDDPMIGPLLQAYFHELLKEMSRFEALGREGETFVSAYLLTMLAVHALLGPRMNDPAMRALRGSKKTRPDAFFASEAAGQGPCRVITRRDSELCRAPLPESAFFGREAELKALRALIRSGGKLIVSGMGGIGKTEIVRQLLAELSTEGVFSRLAFVQYENTLAASFKKAFEHLHSDTEAGWLLEGREILEDKEGGRTLLLIDNLDNTPERDPALSGLAQYACDIIITSRLDGVPLFASYPLLPLPPEAAQALFSYAYGRAPSPEEMPTLNQLLREKALGHPLTLKILAQLARVRRWSTEELLSKMDREGLKLSFTQRSIRTRLPDIYRRLFNLSALSAAQTRLLRLMALFPYRTYTVDWLCLYARDAADSREELDELLSQLRALGWLDENASGFAMHPVIAEALLLTPPEYEAYPRFFNALREALDIDPMLKWIDEDVTDVAAHVIFLLPGIPEEGLSLVRLIFIALMKKFHLVLGGELLRLYARYYLLLPAPAPYTRFLFAGSLCLQEQLHVDILPPESVEALAMDSDSEAFPTFERCRVLLEIMTGQLIARRPVSPRLERAMDGLKKSGNIYLAMIYSSLATYQIAVMGNVAEAETLIQKGFVVLRAREAEQSLYAFELHITAALLYSATFRPDDTLRHIQQARAIAFRWFPDGSSERLPKLYECEYRLYVQTGEYEKALEVMKKQIDVFDRNVMPDFEYVPMYASMGQIHIYLKKFDEAVRWCKKALNTLGDGTDEQHRCGKLRCYGLLGSAYMEKGDIKTARDYLILATRVAKTLGETSTNYAEALYSLAKFYHLNGEKEQARETLTTLLPLFASAYGENNQRYLEAKKMYEDA